MVGGAVTFSGTDQSAANSRYKSCLYSLEEVATSFCQYLNACRIKRSLRYIEQGYKITAIYGLCGFEDFTTFYRNFKRVMGRSPLQYKQKDLPESIDSGRQ